VRLPIDAGPLTDSGLSLAVDSEVVYFDRDVGVTGARLDLFPRLYWDLQRSWGFLRPSAGYRYMAYGLRLENDGGDESPATGLPVLSLDSVRLVGVLAAIGRVFEPPRPLA